MCHVGTKSSQSSSVHRMQFSPRGRNMYVLVQGSPYVRLCPNLLDRQICFILSRHTVLQIYLQNTHDLCLNRVFLTVQKEIGDFAIDRAC